MACLNGYATVNSLTLPFLNAGVPPLPQPFGKRSTYPLPDFLGPGRQWWNQDTVKMGIPVVIKRIKQIFDIHPGFRVSFHVKFTLKKKRIRILPAAEELQESIKLTADGNVRKPQIRRRPDLFLPDKKMH